MNLLCAPAVPHSRPPSVGKTCKLGSNNYLTRVDGKFVSFKMIVQLERFTLITVDGGKIDAQGLVQVDRQVILN